MWFGGDAYNNYGPGDSNDGRLASIGINYTLPGHAFFTQGKNADIRKLRYTLDGFSNAEVTSVNYPMTDGAVNWSPQWVLMNVDGAPLGITFAPRGRNTGNDIRDGYVYSYSPTEGWVNKNGNMGDGSLWAQAPDLAGADNMTGAARSGTKQIAEFVG